MSVLLSAMLPVLPLPQLLVQPLSAPHPMEIQTLANNPAPMASHPTSKGWHQHRSPAPRLLLESLECRLERQPRSLLIFLLTHLKVSLCRFEFAH